MPTYDKLFLVKCENGHSWKTKGNWNPGDPSAEFDEPFCMECGSSLITLLYEEPYGLGR